MSTFHGLEMAKQALFTQQSALYTTGHNIANANTEGYSRQRVNFQADTPMPAAAKNRMGIPGQIGTGVKAGSIERIRNEFLDDQFRGNNSLAGYWEKRAESLGRMENVLNDLHETGLSNVMDNFWSALQDLAVNPTNSGARSVVVQRGIALSDTFNYLNNSITDIRNDLGKEIEYTRDNVDRVVGQIQELNKQIKALEINDYVTNDLYDKRDVLIDELSQILPIEVEFKDSRKKSHDEEVPSNGKKAQMGVAIIKTHGITLVDGVTGIEPNPKEGIISIETNDAGVVSGISIGTNSIPLPFEHENKGTLNSLIKAYGYTGENGNAAGDFLEMQESLKKLAEVFAKEFNSIHRGGIPLTENIPELNDFFDEEAFEGENWEMKVSAAIESNPNLIAAASPREVTTEEKPEPLGDGSNALELANIFNKPLEEDLDGESVRDYYALLIGGLSVEVEEAERMAGNTSVLLTQLEGSRQSVSSVSLDEEMTNLIKFQHAYNAAARTMTATDELLDRIINNMGLVGR